MTSRIDLLSDEEIVYSTTKHWLAPLRASVVPALMILAAFFIGFIKPEGDEGFVGLVSNVLGLVRTGLLVAGIGAIVYHIIVWRSATFAITNRRVIREEGLAARRSSTSMLASITDVQTHMSFMGQRFAYGDLVLFGKSGEAAAERFFLISNPRRFRDQVMEAMHRRRGASDAPPPSTGTQPSVEDDLATLERLAELRDAGAVTVEEFEAKKAEILGRI